MSFLNNIIGGLTHENRNEGQDPGYGYNSQQQYPPQQQGYGGQGPPQVPYPWVAEWDARDGRWFFVNRETGERTFNHPGQGYGGPQAYGGGGGYEQRGYGGQQGYGGGGYEQRGEYYEQQKPSHTGRNAALAGAAGLAGGALLVRTLGTTV